VAFLVPRRVGGAFVNAEKTFSTLIDGICPVQAERIYSLEVAVRRLLGYSAQFGRLWLDIKQSFL